MKQFSDNVWDAFFDWIGDIDDLSDEEVDEELKQRGIDVTSAFLAIMKALRTTARSSELAVEEREAASSLGPDFIQRLLAGERPLGPPHP